MNPKFAATVALLVLFAGIAYADGTPNSVADQCEDACVHQCSANGGTKCGQTCVSFCRADMSKPIPTFSGPVTATPVSCGPTVVTNDEFVAPLACASPAGSATTCTAISGTIAVKSFCGGDVSIYVVCPAGTPYLNPGQATTTTLLARTTSNADCTFSFSPPVTDACGGQTGCYGLLAVTPPPSHDIAPDPLSTTCITNSCPNP